MSFSKRIFLGFFLLLAMVAYALLSTVFDELKPAFSRATEETLVDTANLLAEMLVTDMVEHGSPAPEFARAMKRYDARRFDAHIYQLQKTEPGLRVYVTDHNGIVLFDSLGNAEGADYSRWNDVYLTLRGEYGARATREDPDDEYSAVYHVAAPIRHDGRLLGVVSVGKPSRSLLPYLKASEGKIRLVALLLFAVGIVLAAAFVVWMNGSIWKLTRYADAVSRGEPAELPRLRERELASLGQAMAHMRNELEGKEYVEDTVHALTHELKSPLSALRGAAELLRENPEAKDRDRFLQNIETESVRLQRIVERMLLLASVEKRGRLAETVTVDLSQRVRSVLASRQIALEQHGLQVVVEVDAAVTVQGDAFLLEQAIGNLLDNAIEFSPMHGSIHIALAGKDRNAELRIRDAGPGIPKFAEKRIFEKFYSLPRPGGGAKSTGLGLSFVREVARLHSGSVRVTNAGECGVLVMLALPLA